MKIKVYGVENGKDLDVSTLSATPRAAAVNWLVTTCQILPMHNWSDAMIEKEFEARCGERSARIVKIELGAIKPILSSSITMGEKAVFDTNEYGNYPSAHILAAIMSKTDEYIRRKLRRTLASFSVGIAHLRNSTDMDRTTKARLLVLLYKDVRREVGESKNFTEEMKEFIQCVVKARYNNELKRMMSAIAAE